MIKVGVSHGFLQGGQNFVDCQESGIDIGFPNFEFRLDAGVSEFNLMLINKLPEEIAKFLILDSETIRINFFWTELPANNVELIGDLAEDWCPLLLLSSVFHDSSNKSILGSQIISKLRQKTVNGSMTFMTLDEGLEAMSESGPLRDDHASLV